MNKMWKTESTSIAQSDIPALTTTKATTDIVIREMDSIGVTGEPELSFSVKVLKLGGLLFIQTHQTFPLHAYPFDYFRFTREALAGLFGTRMGFRVISTDYEFPAEIVSEREPELKDLEAFLNVRLFGEKTTDTPDEYIFDF